MYPSSPPVLPAEPTPSSRRHGMIYGRCRAQQPCQPLARYRAFCALLPSFYHEVIVSAVAPIPLMPKGARFLGVS